MGCCPLRPGTRSGGGRRGFSLKMGVIRGPRVSAEKPPGPEPATGQSRCRPGPGGSAILSVTLARWSAVGTGPGSRPVGLGWGPELCPPRRRAAVSARPPPRQVLPHPAGKGAWRGVPEPLEQHAGPDPRLPTSQRAGDGRVSQTHEVLRNQLP